MYVRPISINKKVWIGLCNIKCTCTLARSYSTTKGMLIAHPISSLKMSGTREGTEVIFVKQTKVTFMCPISKLTWVSTQEQSLISFFLFWNCKFQNAKEQKSFLLNKPRWYLYFQVLSWLGFQLKAILDFLSSPSDCGRGELLRILTFFFTYFLRVFLTNFMTK